MSADPDGTDAGPQPTLLLSSERSGSNLLRSILNTHSEISAPHPFETAYPWQNLADPGDLGAGKRRKLVRDVLIGKRYSYHPLTVPLDPDRVAERVDTSSDPGFLDVQRALYEECCAVESTSLWSSKFPGHWDYLDDALAYYDDLRIVYLVRDPRDVVLSFKNSNIEHYHPYFSANRWLDEQSRGVELLGREDVHLVRYEDLLQEPEETAASICSFLDLTFEEEMLYFYETEDAQAASESTELLENLQVPIKSDNFGKYKDALPDEEVALTEYLVANQMERLGYDPETTAEERAAFELGDEETYARMDRQLARRARRDHWREAPREQVRRWLSTSFTAYLYLRYGVLA